MLRKSKNENVPRANPFKIKGVTWVQPSPIPPQKFSLSVMFVFAGFTWSMNHVGNVLWKIHDPEGVLNGLCWQKIKISNVRNYKTRNLVLSRHFSDSLHNFWVVIVFCAINRSWDMVASQEYLPPVLKSYHCVNGVYFKVIWRNRFVGKMFSYDGNTFFRFLLPCLNRKSNEFSQYFIVDVLP